MGDRFSVQNHSGKVLNTLTLRPGLLLARACRTATARVACPNPWEVAKQATLRGPNGSDSEEQFKVYEQLLGGDERASFFHNQSATGLLLGRVVNAENLILGAFGCHGLGGRFDSDRYSEGAEEQSQALTPVPLEGALQRVG